VSAVPRSVARRPLTFFRQKSAPTLGTSEPAPGTLVVSLESIVMLRRVFGLWLVVLIVLPWSAPFPTCDLADLMGHPDHSQTASTSSPSAASLEDGTNCLIPSIADTVSRLKPSGRVLSRAVRQFSSAPHCALSSPAPAPAPASFLSQPITNLRL